MSHHTHSHTEQHTCGKVSDERTLSRYTTAGNGRRVTKQIEDKVYLMRDSPFSLGYFSSRQCGGWANINIMEGGRHTERSLTKCTDNEKIKNYMDFERFKQTWAVSVCLCLKRAASSFRLLGLLAVQFLDGLSTVFLLLCQGVSGWKYSYKWGGMVFRRWDTLQILELRLNNLWKIYRWQRQNALRIMEILQDTTTSLYIHRKLTFTLWEAVNLQSMYDKYWRTTGLYLQYNNIV